MRNITLADKSVCFIAPVGEQAAAVAAPLLSFNSKAATILLLFSSFTAEKKDVIRGILSERLHGIPLEEYKIDDNPENPDWRKETENHLSKLSEKGQRPVLLANGGLMQWSIDLIEILSRIQQQPEPLIVISRDENAAWYNLNGENYSTNDTDLQRIKTIGRDGDPSDILKIAGLELVYDNGLLTGLRKPASGGRSEKTWNPGVPINIEESAGFLRCSLDLGDRLSREKVNDKSILLLRTDLQRSTAGKIGASDWYHEFIPSRDSLKAFGIEPRQLRFKNIAMTFWNEMFVDRIRRHGFVFSSDSAENTPEKLFDTTYKDSLDPDHFKFGSECGYGQDRRRLAVIIGIEPTTTLLTIWKFKPESLYLYYDPASRLSTLFCTRILESLQSEKWCDYAEPVAYRQGEKLKTPPTPFSWNITPGDKLFKIFLILSWRSTPGMTMNRLDRNGELVTISKVSDDKDKTPNSKKNISPPLHQFFWIHAYGAARAIAQNWDTETHQKARTQLVEIIKRYRTAQRKNIAIIVDNANNENNSELRKILADEQARRQQEHPEMSTWDLTMLRGFHWESLVGILVAPLVDELILNSKIVGDLDQQHRRDSEEFDVLFKKGNNYGLLSCKYIGRRLSKSENQFNCREAQNNSERYLGSSSFSAVIYPDVSMFREMLCRNQFKESCDIAGVYHQDEENLIVIDALTFPWMQTDVRSGLMDKLMASASGKGA